MSHTLEYLVDRFRHLSTSEQVEFCSIVGINLPAEAQADWSDDDVSSVAAQTFARLDQEDRNYAHPEAR